MGKFPQPHFVALHSTPGQIKTFFPLVFRPHAVLPEKIGDKISSRITDDWNVKLLHQLNHIFPKPFFIGRYVPWLIDSCVNRPSQMFNKGAVHPFVNFSDFKIFVHNHFCFLRHSTFLPYIILKNWELFYQHFPVSNNSQTLPILSFQI